jgi:hypothetical protein
MQHCAQKIIRKLFISLSFSISYLARTQIQKSTSTVKEVSIALFSLPTASLSNSSPSKVLSSPLTLPSDITQVPDHSKYLTQGS